MAINNIRVEYELFNTDIIDTTITTTVSAGSTYDSSEITVDNDKKLNINFTSAESADSEGNISSVITLTFDKPQAMCGIRLHGNATKAKLRYVEYGQTYGDTVIGDVSDGKNIGGYSNGMTGHPGIYSIQLTIQKITAGDTHAQLDDIQFSVLESHDANDLFSIDTSKAAFLYAEEGNGGSLSFVQCKENSVFEDTLDAELKQMPDTIKKGKKVSVYVTTDTENKFFEYYTTDMIDEDGAIRIEAEDLLMSLNESMYRKGEVHTEGRTLAKWAQDVATDAGVLIEIPNELSDYVSKGYITEVSHREAFRLIAEAGNCLLRVTEDGKISMKFPQPPPLWDERYNAGENVAEGSLAVADRDNIRGIRVNKYKYVEQDYLVELGYIESMALDAAPQHVDITYAKYPVKVSTVEVFVHTGTITNKHVYSDRIEFDIAGSGSTYITIIGIPYDVVNTVSTRGMIDKNVKEIKDNFLIGDNLFASAGEVYEGDVLTEDIDYGDAVAIHQYNYVANKNEYEFEDISGDIISIPQEIQFMGVSTHYTGLETLLDTNACDIHMTDTEESITITGIAR